MFNPTNIDEVSVQAIHLEASKGKYAIEDKNPHKFKRNLKENGSVRSHLW
jgi:hypothetical protein